MLYCTGSILHTGPRVSQTRRSSLQNPSLHSDISDKTRSSSPVMQGCTWPGPDCPSALLSASSPTVHSSQTKGRLPEVLQTPRSPLTQNLNTGHLKLLFIYVDPSLSACFDQGGSFFLSRALLKYCFLRKISYLANVSFFFFF